MHKDQKNLVYGASALAVVLVVAAAFFVVRTMSVPMVSFSNAEYGISFEYPENYELTEHHVTGRHTIVIADKVALGEAPQNGEGPTSITFDIFENAEGLSPEEWVRTNNQSNFQLSPDGNLATSAEGDAESVAYVWDGLYRGESYVFENGEDIVMASVTMLSPEDQIKIDFEKILRTLTLE